MRPFMRPGLVGRFLGSWRLALGELVIVSLGVNQKTNSAVECATNSPLAANVTRASA